jgi:hypothetical protein
MTGTDWGEIYPAEEELWELQLSPMEGLYHDCHLLRYELSRVDDGIEGFNNEKLIEIDQELGLLEQVRLF